MNLVAKPIVKDKFWIVEKDNGDKVATIQSTDNGVVFVHEQQRETFPSIKLLSKKFNIAFDKPKSLKKKQDETEYQVYGYFSAFKPFNELYDVTRKLPIFTKTKKSKSFFCAGYYIIRFEKQWVSSVNPKLITLKRYEFKGPFKNKVEMLEQLRIANGATHK